jgi:hypothetical protein
MTGTEVNFSRLMFHLIKVKAKHCLQNLGSFRFFFTIFILIVKNEQDSSIVTLVKNSAKKGRFSNNLVHFLIIFL